jgi:hypothetical protein
MLIAVAWLRVMVLLKLRNIITGLWLVGCGAVLVPFRPAHCQPQTGRPVAEPMPNERDRAMFENPDKWPLNPLLPIKRYKGRKQGEFPDLAILLKHNEFYLVVHAMLHGFSPEVLHEALSSGNCEIYDSVDELMTAGWLVD